MNNLVAIGTAAVLTVYAAGYVRTRGAALRFAEAEAAARRPPAAMVPAAAEPPELTAAAPPPAAATTGNAADPEPAGPPVATKPAPPPAGNKPPAEPAAVAIDSALVIASAGDSTPAVPGKEAPPPAPSSNADSVTAGDSTAKRGPYRDGQYFGWGTSRHGDIQAGIEIKDGHIAGAWVAQCLTRYSCSWISALPGQVVARQSPETDYVSGATQSTNAFYYAVVEALSKAK